MNDPAATATPSARRYYPLLELVRARVREFLREPEAVFWTYGFPIIMMVILGAAFQSRPTERITVDVQAGPRAEETSKRLSAASKPGELEFSVRVSDEETCRQRLRTGKTDLVVIVNDVERHATYQYWLDKARTESRLARTTVDGVLQQSGRTDAAPAAEDLEMSEPGSRYIDFLVPGLLGMGLMGGGMWGVGFVVVDMRIRKLMKRFLATPMRRSDFLLGMMLSRLVFMVPEVLIVLVFAWLVFGVVIYGSLAAVLFLVLLGAFAFAGIGLLVASRAKTIEMVSGLLNLTMLPMWVASGVFFSTERFPEPFQPFIHALPLTPLIAALRNVMLEGASLASQWPQIAILAAYGTVSFVVALKIFRWQ